MQFQFRRDVGGVDVCGNVFSVAFFNKLGTVAPLAHAGKDSPPVGAVRIGAVVFHIEGVESSGKGVEEEDATRFIGYCL